MSSLVVLDVEIPQFITDHIENTLDGIEINMFHNVDDSFKENNLHGPLTEWLIKLMNENVSIIGDKILTRKGLKLSPGEWHKDEIYYEDDTELYKCALLWVDGPNDTGNVMFLNDDGSINEIPFRKNKILIFDADVYHRSCEYNSNETRKAVLITLAKPEK